MRKLWKACTCTCNEFEFDSDLRAKFEFGGRFGRNSFSCVSSDQQERFQTEFQNSFERVRDKLFAYGWLSSREASLPPRVTTGPYQPEADLNVFVSEAYRRSQALIPAWQGHRGWMEFPAYRVVAGQAAIAHELTHVLFPNGNRMLAEGLAVYLQHKLFPERPVFPNFGDELESVVAEFVFTHYPKRTPYALWNMDIEAFEQISTPDMLSLRIGRDSHVGADPLDTEPPPEVEKFLYAIAGSFVGFLLENPFGVGDVLGDGVLTEKHFGDLYLQTPLQPFSRNAGRPDRWQKCYEGEHNTLKNLVLLWKTYMHFILLGNMASVHKRGEEGAFSIPNTLPEKYGDNKLVQKAYAKLSAI